MTTEEILQAITDYEGSSIYRDMQTYKDYYEVKNPDTMRRWNERERKHKTPNWQISTPYYATVVDTMGGYMFSDVEYESDDSTYEEQLKALLETLHIGTVDMITGTYALAYNRAYELVYSSGDATVDVKLAGLDPLSITPIYDDSIEQKLIAVIWKRTSNKKVLIDYIDAKTWEYYEYTRDGEGIETLKERQEPKALYFSRCPVVEYRSELIGEAPPFSVVISYISALDWAITGNSNEIDRIVDALLLIGKKIKAEDVEHMGDWKILDDLDKEGLTPQFLTKNLSPEFRKYVTDLLVREIYKHCHIVDFASEALVGDASAKALKIRLFDMNMFSNRIEKIYRISLEDRITLLGELMTKVKTTISPEPVKITLKRTMPTDMETLMQALSGVDYLSDQTKIGLLGIDWEMEKERLEEEAPDINLDAFTAPTIVNDNQQEVGYNNGIGE